MNILTLSGNPHVRGVMYGESLRGEIQEQIQWFRNLFSESAHMDPDALFANVATLGWMNAALQWTPSLIDEMHGIASGSNCSFQDIFAWNHVQEVFWYVSTGLYTAPEGPVGCSVVGDSGDANHLTILAQNADTISFWHGHQTLLRIQEPESDLELIMLSYPGIIGVYGLNNQGVGICVNALFYKLNNSLNGLGTPLMTRGILSHPSYPEAVNFLKTAPHASSNTLTLGGPGTVTAFEVSANQVCPFMLDGESGRTCHTNHELVNQDYRPGMSPDPYPNSVERMKLLEKGLSDVVTHLTIADAQKILTTHGAFAQLCRHEDDSDGSMTTYSMIMELSQNPALYASFGPPCREGYHKFVFNFSD